MSVSFRPYMVYIRGSQPMGCGPVGGNGIIVRVLHIHTSGGTKHKLNVELDVRLKLSLLQRDLSV